MFIKYFLGLVLLVLYELKYVNAEFCFSTCAKNQCDGVGFDKCSACEGPSWLKKNSGGWGGWGSTLS